MEKQERNLVRGTVIGIGIGVLIGLLYAPRSGKESRDRLATRGKDTLDDVEQRLGEVRHELDDRIDALRDLAATISEEASVQSQDLLAKAEVLKTDLSGSAANLAKNTGKARADAVVDAKRLVKQGADILSELERATRQVVQNTKQRATDAGPDA